MNQTSSFGAPEPYYIIYRDLIASKIDKALASFRPSPTDPLDELRLELQHFSTLFDIAVYLLHSPEVEASRKAILVSAVAYVIAPRDLIPDDIPMQGLLDDLLALGYSLDRFYNEEEPNGGRRILTNWANDPDGREIAANIVTMASDLEDLLPKGLVSTLHSMFGS